MSVGIYFSGIYVKIYKIKSGLGQRGGGICFPLKTPSSLLFLKSEISSLFLCLSRPICFESAQNPPKEWFSEVLAHLRQLSLFQEAISGIMFSELYQICQYLPRPIV